ncbi:RNA binding protein [Mycena chlorophos]|uniref:RNA binding protein n=1 Tax=Mycena chlorophos TaxID=658473 RepID=A0A8H6WAR7_MYCCL|nr:RNA binding protein [Mycena chlorophos]
MPPKTNARAWGTRFDTLPSSPPPTPPPAVKPIAVAATDDAPAFKKVDKAVTPHDASVFVGSLPGNIEQGELTRLLGDHLSAHNTIVKSIKIVRDSKGGVCAFVQCESAAAASALISSLHSAAPKPFFGRILRFERARAFRTLLISYRPPVQTIPSPNGKGPGETIELDLPHAMRMWRPRNSKYLSILYNNEAIEAEKSASREHGCDPVLFMQPVVMDQATIESICALFGPLEYFNVLKKPDDADGQGNPRQLFPYPAPHDGPRLPGMDTGCFEIKWVHRDDSVSALMTLRRVPHLTVTWAHQPQQAPDFYPPHLANHHQHHQAQTQPFAQSSPDDPNLFSISTASADDWNSANSGHAEGVEWTSDVDFPPLGDAKSDRRTENGVWADKKSPRVETEERAPSQLSVVIAENDDQNELVATAGGEAEDPEQELVMPDTPETPGLGMSPVTPKTTESQQFPTTPTSVAEEIPKEPGYFGASAEAKEIDPTSLFVGGLEMHGPDAWDERRVTALFGKYGGLQSVKVVKPLNAKAAFAFVKFDNTEAPAQAVYHEHNTVHQGRTIRVQLRDCNPPRGTWRFNNGRGRGRFNPHPHFIHNQRRFADNADREVQLVTNGDLQTSNDLTEEMAALSLAEEKASGHEEAAVVEVMAEVVPATRAQSHSAPVSRHATPEPTHGQPLPDQPATEYREWYDPPASATMTPPLNAAVPAAPGSPPYGGYYPPPWAQAYPQQVAYGVPFYPGYAYPRLRSSHNNSRAPTAPMQADLLRFSRHLAGRCMGFVYVPYPYARPPIAGDKTSPNQAPLQPTGFFQNHLGTLIPMYQQEALDQYLTSNQPTPTPTTQPQVQVAQGSIAAPPYQQYPPPPAYGFPHNPMMGLAGPPRPFQPSPAINEVQAQQAWLAQAQAQAQGVLTIPNVPSQGHSPNLPPMPFRGPFPDVIVNGNVVNGPNQHNNRRQGPGGRREQGNNANNRNNGGGQHKGMQGRQPPHNRGMQFSPSANLVDLPAHMPRPPHGHNAQFQASVSADRGHWIST